MFAALFALFYVGHLLADYPFQTDHQASHKADRTAEGWRANLLHAGTHAATCGVLLAIGAGALADVHLSIIPAAIALAWIGLTHSFIDRRWAVAWWMDHTGQADFRQHGGAAHVDQTAHIAALAAAALFLAAV